MRRFEVLKILFKLNSSQVYASLQNTKSRLILDIYIYSNIKGSKYIYNTQREEIRDDRMWILLDQKCARKIY